MKSIYGLATTPLAFYNLCVDVFAKVGLQRLRTDEYICINMRGTSDFALQTSSQPLLTNVLSSLVDVPEGNRVYPSCPGSFAMLIVVQYRKFARSHNPDDDSVSAGPGIYDNCKRQVNAYGETSVC